MHSSDTGPFFVDSDPRSLVGDYSSILKSEARIYMDDGSEMIPTMFILLLLAISKSK